MLHPAERLEGIPIPVVSLDDATCMKVSAIAGRGAARDFWDLHAILVTQSLSLEQVLALFKRKYATEDIGHVIKSFSYFGDADASPLPRGLGVPAWATIKADFESRVKSL
jgi:hypothetical protein